MERTMRRLEVATLFLVFMLSFIIKTYRVENGDFVIWDEAHFGKFSEKYLSRKFYFDVHPPLGKMLTSLSGYIFNQPPDFEFKSGDKFPEGFDYSGMRRFHSFIASFTPVFSYLILREVGYSYRRRTLLSLLFIFENGFTSIGRLVLLDSHLLTFTAAVAYFMTRLYYKSKRSTDTPSLLLLGLTLGCVLSVKWIGFLTMSLVGVFTIYQLWCNITSRKSILEFFTMFLSRALCLIALPLVIYVLLFYIHFRIVNQSSSDDGHMSSFFQAGLKGSEIHNNRKYPLFGARITIKSSKSGGGYLHSHDHTYPDSGDNQVTTYHHKDENNKWSFQKVTDDLEDAKFIGEEDTIVILHLETKKYLDVPGGKSLISGGLLVGCSGSQLSESSLFRVEIVDDKLGREDKVKSLTTRFRLRNVKNDCYLRSSSKKYPQWGFEQGAVVCSRKRDDTTLWNVEENMSDKLGEEVNPVYKEAVKYSFLKKLAEHNMAMFATNASFVQDEDLEPERIVSRPYEWFILRRGLRMTAWGDTNEKFYMFGNPFTWYLSSICVVSAPMALLAKVIKRKRRRRSLKFLRRDGFLVFLTSCGWLLHYVPFFFVGRVLYFHHYYPALFFALFSVCYFLKNVSFLFLAAVTSVAITSFFLYSRLTYGFEAAAGLHAVNVVPTWDFIEK